MHKREAAPPGYSVVHVHRTALTGRKQKLHGGGVALIHRDDIRVKVVPTTPATTSTFELSLVKIINCTIDTTIAIIYRPPDSKSAEFISELSDLIDSGILGSRYIICGDMNCPGPSGSKGLIGIELGELIDAYSLKQHVKCPTHQSGNILDHILSSEGTDFIHDVIVSDVGLSDHYIVTCKVSVNVNRQPIVRATFRNWKKLDLDSFKERVLSSSCCVQPASTAEGYASQLESDITRILDELVPVCTSTKRRGKPESRWLSPEAVAAKQFRRRLERKWKSTGVEKVRIAYRVACRAANKLITESRRAFYASRVSESSRDPRALWKCVKGLLHTNKSTVSHEPGMSERFSAFFHEKIVKAKNKVSMLRKELSSSTQHPGGELHDSEVTFDILIATSESEVSKLISRLPNKSSPLDYIHTSVLVVFECVYTDHRSSGESNIYTGAVP